jgi:hypothetical protein
MNTRILDVNNENYLLIQTEKDPVVQLPMFILVLLRPSLSKNRSTETVTYTSQDLDLR